MSPCGERSITKNYDPTIQNTHPSIHRRLVFERARQGRWLRCRHQYGRLKKFKSKCYCDTTSNRMELKGVIFALEHIKPGYRIDIYSDSTYVTRGTNEWIGKWMRQRILDEKANPDLWKRLVKALNIQKNKGSKITVNWVRGHAGNTFNEMADRLAFAAATAGSPVVCKKDN